MKKEKSLIRKGILDLKPYIPGKPIEEVKRELGLKEVIKLASPAYETAAKIMGGKIIPIKLKDYSYDLEEIARRINKKTKIIFICNPNNPTGIIVDKEAVNRFTK